MTIYLNSMLLFVIAGNDDKEADHNGVDGVINGETTENQENALVNGGEDKENEGTIELHNFFRPRSKVLPG